MYEKATFTELCETCICNTCMNSYTGETKKICKDYCKNNCKGIIKKQNNSNCTHYIPIKNLYKISIPPLRTQKEDNPFD